MLCLSDKIPRSMFPLLWQSYLDDCVQKSTTTTTTTTTF